jgi:iron complex outermembrane recepter protein
MNMKSASGKLDLVLAGVSAAALMHASAGFAQDAANSTPAAATSGSGFEEIVVTAQKRSENIRDVPISITALTSNDIERSGVTNIVGLTNVVPGLKMDRVGAVILPAIRGISTLTTTGGVEPNVATYVDNIYMGGSAGAIQTLPDVSRIDVLKGPQGTLFGRNATGGAIQIFTKEPNMDSLGGEVSAGYGNFDTLTLKGFVSAPIIVDKVALSVSGYRETADNYNKTLTPNVPIADTDNYTVRGKLLFKPAEGTRILLTAMLNQQSDPSAILYSPLNGITVAKAVPGAIYPTKPYQVASNLSIPLKSRAKMVSMEFNQETELGDITVLGAWRRQNNVLSRTTATAFAYPAPYTGVNYTISGADTAKQAEIDFASKKFGAFSFVLGANYYKNRSGGNPSNIVTNTPTASSAITAFGGQTSDTWAVFGEATLQLTDKLSVVGGLRYSHEKRGVFGSILPGVVAKDQGNMYEWATRTFKSVTQKAAIRYEVSPETNAYFTYSTGFRSGNFDSFSIPFGNRTPADCDAANAAVPGSCPLPISVKPEKLTAFEIGVKSAPSPWLRFDAAIYYYKLSEIQILSFSNVCLQAPCPPNPTTPLGRLSNAATTSIYGAEVAVDARLTNELRVQGSISILDAEFSDYENTRWNVPAPGGLGLIQTPVVSATGKQMPRAPKATASLTATYTKDLPLGVVSLTANGYATKRIYFDVGNVFYQPSYATLGLRASLSPSSVPGLTASVWGNNLTDNSVILSTFLNAYGALASYAPPRTYGVTLGYKF